MKTVICGGGNISHALAGFLAAQQDNEVTVVTRKPSRWGREITVCHSDHAESFCSTLHDVVSDYSVVQDAEVVFISLPCFARHEVLTQIREWLSPETLVVIIPGVGGADFEMEGVFHHDKVCYFHRTPYVSRILEYGKRVCADKKQYCSICFSAGCTSREREWIRRLNIVETREFHTPWLLSLSNSNPIIHIARLCELSHTRPHKKQPLFYAEWGLKASEFALKMDAELKQVLLRLHAVEEYVPLLTYYESSDAESLTRKINSIRSLHSIPAPSVLAEDCWEIDATSRYLTEDLPYGTCFIKFMAQILGVKCPTLDSCIRTLQELMGELFVDADGIFSEAVWTKYVSPKIVEQIRKKVALL